MTTTNNEAVSLNPPEVLTPQKASAVVLASPLMPRSDPQPSPERQRNLVSEFEEIDSGYKPSYNAAEDAQDSEVDVFTPAVSADEEPNGDAETCDVSTGDANLVEAYDGHRVFVTLDSDADNDDGDDESEGPLEGSFGAGVQLPGPP
ncbi:hypothetical protein DVH05_007021 [Phytophthora capsici]|nr:hypothetical protein DVH05_007021 [Phytophthora capsici]